ncbi:uncharacterized protein SAPINGB_P003044 [Magnusiomyces paraingens]|uniref:Alpha box domain-containing protein n=1 Tax=Magnusiomyces paraingens TaxID=2606893 RepID=A0A5E8BIA6_9ASCO|nr:uncharacterized protein SAPINGB_P003044 [Saprochaete ingens]VVT51280.1 unnamed protein product [Saprochaete ingens]
MNKVTTYFIDFNAPQEGTESCNHTEELPAIPEMSLDLRSALEQLKALHLSSNKTKKKRFSRSQNHKPSKIHGFTAYKSYYSRNFLSVSQGLISAILSKAWALEKNQHVWDLYAKLYRRYKRNLSFSEWLEKNTVSAESSNFEFDEKIKSLNTSKINPSAMYETFDSSSSSPQISLDMQPANFVDSTLQLSLEVLPSSIHAGSGLPYITTDMSDNSRDFVLHLTPENNTEISNESLDVTLSMISSSSKISSSYNDLLHIFGPEWLQESEYLG